MNHVIATIIAGIVGTAGMSIALWAVTRTGIAPAPMIRAIGSMFTGSYDNSFTPGLIIHFIVGILIAFVYALLISLFSPGSIAGYIGAGAMIGVFHGVAFGFILVIAVAEHHPLEQFREAGSQVAIGHFVGHVIYGILVGAVLGMTGARFFY